MPIRLMHLEPRRIVIDVAGPSGSIDQILTGLTTVLGELKASDGAPAIGSPSAVRDQSEISAHFAFPLDALFAPGLDAVFSEGMGHQAVGQITVPSVTVQVQESSAEYVGTGPVTQVNGPMLQLAPRQGTLPGEQIYYSIAPLGSDAHLAYLGKLEQVLSGDVANIQTGPPGRRKRRTSKSIIEAGTQ